MHLLEEHVVFFEISEINPKIAVSTLPFKDLVVWCTSVLSTDEMDYSTKALIYAFRCHVKQIYNNLCAI